MSEEAHAQVEIMEIPAPSTDEMVKFLAARMDELFDSIGQIVPFTTGDVMSACLCHIVEAGRIGRGEDMEGLRQDILQSVEIAIAHYGRPDKEKRH